MVTVQDKVQLIVADVGTRFRTFGGGVDQSDNNPLSSALKNSPLTFAAGVSVEEVVRFVLSEASKE